MKLSEFQGEKGGARKRGGVHLRDDLFNFLGVLHGQHAFKFIL